MEARKQIALPAQDVPRINRLRILSYNIQIGISTSRYRHYMTNSWKHVIPYPGRIKNLESIGEWIAEFDLVGLQELDAGSIRTDFINQAEYLARIGQFPFWRSQVNRNLGRFAKHSMGILSQFEPSQVVEHRLPGAIPGRGAMEVHYGSGDSALVVILLHLSLSRNARTHQIRYIIKQLEMHKHVIVMGDLNCATDSQEIQALLQSTRLCEPEYSHSTYPSWRPVHSVDHIFVTPELKIEKSTVYQVNYSDHLPIGVEITLPDDVVLISNSVAKRHEYAIN